MDPQAQDYLVRFSLHTRTATLVHNGEGAKARQGQGRVLTERLPSAASDKRCIACLLENNRRGWQRH